MSPMCRDVSHGVILGRLRDTETGVGDGKLNFSFILASKIDAKMTEMRK